jgi:hypothetical protein
MTARIALLDSRFLIYEQAVIGTVLTTLNSGSVILTLSPNYSVSLSDPNLPTVLKVQLQVLGAEQVRSIVMANLHHHLVYRLQSHSLDLPNIGSSSVPMVVANLINSEAPTIIEIPRSIQRSELLQLMPTEWITNYENLHKKQASIQASTSSFQRLLDGKVKTLFQLPNSDQPRRSFT